MYCILLVLVLTVRVLDCSQGNTLCYGLKSLGTPVLAVMLLFCVHCVTGLLHLQIMPVNNYIDALRVAIVTTCTILSLEKDLG